MLLKLEFSLDVIHADIFFPTLFPLLFCFRCYSRKNFAFDVELLLALKFCFQLYSHCIFVIDFSPAELLLSILLTMNFCFRLYSREILLSLYSR